MFEPGNVVEPSLKRVGDYLVRLLFRLAKKIAPCVVRDIPPAIVSPEVVHPLDIGRVHTLGILPKNVSIHVLHGEIQEHVQAFHFSRF